jgi:hypothetical protein
MGNEDLRIAGIQETTRIGSAQESLRIAGEYLAAVNTRNLHAIGKTLHPDLHFMGPAGEVHNRESFLETYNKVFAHLKKLDMTSEALANNLVYFKYYMVMPAPIGPIQGTMKTTHAEDGLIKKIEMVYHSAMLENNSNPKK